jgi:mono/diheme cytochrome c family protein
MAPTHSHSRYAWLTLWLLTASTYAVEHPGAVIYKKMCQECHGTKGQGVKDKYDDPLTGDLTLEALARKIERTMPEDKEGTCVGEDAKQVAAYIYDAFYSGAAQARSHPPDQDLSRLTIAQYRTSVMDLIGRFRMGPGFDRPIGAEAGLKANYRGTELPKPGEPVVDTTAKKGIKAKRANYKFDRVDAQVAFHFGADSPDKEKMEADQFQETWDGSVVAEETGVYEFTLKTENGARLWINDTSENDALIDAWVSAGPTVREEKKSIYLVGGRAYRLRLDHFKFKEQSASIELWWKPPHGMAELIPQHALRTERPRELMIVNTSFPADDRSVGYERGTSISKGWDQATTDAAISTAEHVVENLNELAGTKEGAPDRVVKLKNFAFTLVEAAFCRPLTEEQKQLFVEAHFKSAKSPEQAVKRVVLFTLKSPQFLYPELREAEKPDDFAFASRLALTLWDSIPDKKLIQVAAAGKLRTPEQIRAEAQRMLSDTRTKAKLHGFFHHWLELERAEGNAKDMKVFPGFDDSVQSDLRESLFEFLDQVVWSPQSDYRQLLQADYLLLNDRLGKFYGKPVQGSAFQQVSFDPKQRAGVVTHPYLLASLASSRATSPIHRGVFLTRNIVGLSLRPPPMAVTFDESHFNPKLTMREKITELTRNKTCMSCHSTINPLGFSLENYDAIGRWRTQDNNKPVNAVGDFADDEGRVVHLTGPRDIVNYVASSPYGHRAFIRQLFNHFVKQQPLAYGPQTLEDLQKSFAASNCNVQKLLVDLALVAVVSGRELVPATP